MLAPPGTGAPFAPPPPLTLVGAGVSEVEAGEAEVWFALAEGLVEFAFELEALPEGFAGGADRVTVVRMVATAVVV